MKRLTTKNGNGKPIVKDWPNYMEFDIINRLAAIEDILGDTYDLDRLCELAQADREGRCVVFPCKPGDTVYQLTPSICKWRETNKCDRCPGYGACWEGTTIIEPVQFETDMIDSVGTDIFLTRAEAEEALRREQE